jgi:hypothetical protein
MILDDFRAKFPEFESVPDDVINSIIAEYRCYYNFGYDEHCCKQTAILYLIAHLVYLQQNPTNSPIREASSQSVGSVSVSFGLTSKTAYEAFFNSTPYGQRYLLIRCPVAGASIV